LVFPRAACGARRCEASLGISARFLSSAITCPRYPQQPKDIFYKKNTHTSKEFLEKTVALCFVSVQLGSITKT
jgi:hypothetical protein